MGKSKESKQVNKDASNEYDYLGNRRSGYDSTINDAQTRGTDAYNRSAGAYDSALGGLDSINSAADSLMGGVSPADTSALKGDASTYRNYAQGNTETGQFFRNLMNTGGYSEGELGDIRQAGTRIIPSFFSNLRNQMRTAQNATGGYSPGYGASAAAMARDAAHQSQDAALDTELGISDRVRTGKLTGANSLNEMFMGGMGGASDLEKAVVQADLASKGLDLQSKTAGAGLYGNAGQLALGVGSGYSDLRRSVPGEALAYEDLVRGYGSDISGNVGQRMQYNPNQSFFDKYGMPILNAGVGAISGGWNPASAFKGGVTMPKGGAPKYGYIGGNP